jgi:hypothetical protein
MVMGKSRLAGRFSRRQHSHYAGRERDDSASDAREISHLSSSIILVSFFFSLFFKDGAIPCRVQV